MQQKSPFDKTSEFAYSYDMFVSFVLDPGDIETSKAIVSILLKFDFKKVQRACYENLEISESQLSIVKNEIDKVTNYYDTIRIYQFPVNGNFSVTELREKKWKRAVFGIEETLNLY